MGTLTKNVQYRSGGRIRARRTQSECMHYDDDEEAMDSMLSSRKADEIHYPDIRMGAELAEGAFGQVFRGRLFGKEVAVKVLKGQKGNGKVIRAFQKEIDIMKECRHPNVVEYLGACYDPNHLCIVTAYYDRGSLGGFMQRMRKEGKKPSIYFIIKTAIMVAQGLAWLHMKGIIHRDLKPDNVLLDRGDNVRICDFGVSHAPVNVFLQARHFYGSPPYTAPEVMRPGQQGYDVSADIYSFGVLLVSLLKCGDPFDHCQLPKEDDDNKKFMQAVVEGLRPNLPKDTDATVVNLIKSCFKPPAHRPSSEQLVSKLQNIMTKMNAMEADLMDAANPALQNLFQQKDRAIETLQVRLDMTDKALKEEKTIKADLLKKTTDHSRALRNLEKELEQMKKKLMNAEKKLAKKAEKEAKRAAV